MSHEFVRNNIYIICLHKTNENKNIKTQKHTSTEIISQNHTFLLHILTHTS